MICNHDFDYFCEVIDYDCDYIVFSMNVIDYDYGFAIVIVIVPTIAITDYDYPMPDHHVARRHLQLAQLWRGVAPCHGALCGRAHLRI